MKKFILVISLILVVSLLSSCELETGEEEEEQFIFGLGDFAGGTDAIEFSFERDSPPETVYSDDSFDIIFEAENLGEYNIQPNEMKFIVWNLPSSRFDISNSEIIKYNQQDFMGMLVEDGDETPGDRREFVIEDDIRPEVDSIPAGGMPFSVKGGLCFKYMTDSVASLCLVGDDRNPDQVCDPNDDPEIINSGSPIQVNNFRQSLSGSRINFNFMVSHQGSGRFLDNSEDGGDVSCTDKGTRQENMVFLELNSPQKDIDCGFADEEGPGQIQSGLVSLYNNERFISCQVEGIDNNLNEVVPVDINIDFNYYQTIQKDFTLRE